MSDKTFWFCPVSPAVKTHPPCWGAVSGVAGMAAGSQLRTLSFGSTPLERPALASVLLQCQPFLTPQPCHTQGKPRHGAMPPHAREGCQWAGPGHPGKLRQGRCGVAIMGRSRRTWTGLRGRGCPCFRERTQGTSPLRVRRGTEESRRGPGGTSLSKAFASQSCSDGPAPQPLWAQMLSARPGPASGQGDR